jgi:hypothetical protein
MRVSRRQFAQTTALAAAGVALAGTEALAAPPDWQKFEFVVHVTFKKFYAVPGTWGEDAWPTVGWKATWHDGVQYGDYVIIKDIIDGDDDPVIAECKALLQFQADQVKHQLIKEEGWPCNCWRCQIDTKNAQWYRKRVR